MHLYKRFDSRFIPHPVAVMPTWLSLVILEVVIMATAGATSDNKLISSQLTISSLMIYKNWLHDGIHLNYMVLHVNAYGFSKMASLYFLCGNTNSRSAQRGHWGDKCPALMDWRVLVWPGCMLMTPTILPFNWLCIQVPAMGTSDPPCLLKRHATMPASQGGLW